MKPIAIISLPDDFGQSVANDARRLGYREYLSNGSDLDALLRQIAPEVALVNIDTPRGLESVALCRRRMGSSSKIAAVTDIPCLLRAGEVVRLGASVVLARPTTFLQIIAALEGKPRLDLPPMSLDRAIWEYLNQTLSETGSIAAAARRLRLDRTSFKRMLRKRPPTW